jgi:hypothetical protein
MARRASARVPSGIVAMTSPLDGLVASNVTPLSDGAHAPPTNSDSDSTST